MKKLNNACPRIGRLTGKAHEKHSRDKNILYYESGGSFMYILNCQILYS